ncbi:hypothetical protein SAY86_030113 [Trapa natans]|uniref:Uncharacterized protein n=1 Tax=Trapa natans TaxID=22666 RepID=A0AAN7M4J0_TRANT|nr:hypothetical protein SAY86_030113 [Trapa natans]
MTGSGKTDSPKEMELIDGKMGASTWASGARTQRSKVEHTTLRDRLPGTWTGTRTWCLTWSCMIDLPRRQYLQSSISDWPGADGQQMWRMPKDGDAVATRKPRRKSVDGRLSVSDISGTLNEDIAETEVNQGDGIPKEDYEARLAAAKRLLKVRPPKRQGETISKGHRNYELMLNLQLGIRSTLIPFCMACGWKACTSCKVL